MIEFPIISYKLYLLNQINHKSNIIYSMDIHQENLELPQCWQMMMNPSPFLTPLLATNSIYHENIYSEFDLLNFDLVQPEACFDCLDVPKQCGNMQSHQLVTELSGENIKQQSEQKYMNQVENPPLLYLIIRCRQLIRMLVQKTNNEDEELLRLVKSLTKNSDKMMEVFKILHKKFKKLKKTKEEMIKYCMRKAFKFANQKTHKQTHRSTQINHSFLKKINQKTMNGTFLSQLFAEPSFNHQYSEFLEQLKYLIDQDNEKKIQYLANIINQHLQSNNFKKIQLIKRLPWTRQILIKTYNLGFQLPKYAEPNHAIQSNKKHKLI